MITSIHIKNFLSIEDTIFDLTKLTKINHFSLLCGENGAGKSNILKSISLLKELIDYDKNMTISEIYNKYKNKMCNGPIYLEYDFLLNNKKGSYLLVLSEQGVIEEQLRLTLNKNICSCYRIHNSEVVLSTKFFNNNMNKYKEIICPNLNQYAVLSSLVKITNCQFLSAFIKAKEDLPLTFFCFIDWINNILISDTLDIDLLKGIASKEYKDKLTILAKICSQFLSNIDDLYYSVHQYDKNHIEYKLYGKNNSYKVTIDFEKESEGIKQIVYLIYYLLEATKNKIVVIDNIDTNVHPILLKSIIEFFYNKIEGQVIYTSSNSIALLDIKELKNMIYVVDHGDIKNINSFRRIFDENNLLSLYCKGTFGGIPTIDQNKLSEAIKNVN